MNGTQTALKFILEARKNEGIKTKIKEIMESASLNDLVKIGQEQGFSFTTEDLKEAFKHDWNIRWHRYNPVLS